MFIGIGVDIEEVARFRKLRRTDDRRFLERVFTSRELAYCFGRKNPGPHLAARFCAKEAVIKALAGLAIHKMSYRDIEILNTAKGVPSVKLHTKVRGLQVSVSLAHSKDSAIAFTIIQRV